MSGLEKYFKSTKSNPIQDEFIRQCAEIKKEVNEPKNEDIEQKLKLQSVIDSLKIENREIKQKYERLKAKHVQLLQVLLTQEQKVQNLEKRFANLDESAMKSNSHCDVVAELVILHSILM